MRLATALFGLTLGLCVSAIQADAVPMASRGLETNSPIIEVAVHCGPHAHYVRGHRNHAGQYVKGRCIRDKR
jgi:hypothetical protein